MIVRLFQEHTEPVEASFPSQPPYLAAGLVDEMLISLVPVFLGAGTRLFDNLGTNPPRPRQVEAIEAPGVTHLRYRF